MTQSRCITLKYTLKKVIQCSQFLYFNLKDFNLNTYQSQRFISISSYLNIFRFQRFQYHDNIVLIQEFHTYHIPNLGKDIQDIIITNQNLVKA